MVLDASQAPGAILVTGAAGFAGSHLVELLAETRSRIVGWHRPGRQPPSGPAGISWQGVDVLDARAVRTAIEQVRPSQVLHLAAATHVGRSWDTVQATFATNVRGTHNLLEALRDTGIRTRVLIPSSAMVYRPSNEPLSEEHPVGPPNPYGLSKLTQELLAARASNGRVQVVIGRAFNHIGPRQDPSFAASGFARQIAEIESGLRAAEVVVGNLAAERDTSDVRDTVRAYRLILEQGEAGRPYNVSSDRTVAIGDILEMLRARARVPIHVRVDADRLRPHDSPRVLGDSRRLRRELGWTPTIPLSQTLDDLLEYWRSHLPAGRA